MKEFDFSFLAREIFRKLTTQWSPLKKEEMTFCKLLFHVTGHFCIRTKCHINVNFTHHWNRSMRKGSLKLNICCCSIIPIKTAFNWVWLNQNQSNHSSQSQRTQTVQWTNQKSKKLHVADEKRGKREGVNIGSGFTADWMKKWREFFKPRVAK